MCVCGAVCDSLVSYRPHHSLFLSNESWLSTRPDTSVYIAMSLSLSRGTNGLSLSKTSAHGQSRLSQLTPRVSAAALIKLRASGRPADELQTMLLMNIAWFLNRPSRIRNKIDSDAVRYTCWENLKSPLLN